MSRLLVDWKTFSTGWIWRIEMKAAMITEEQITAIKEVLVFYCIPLNEEKFRAAFEAVESLEVQEPFSYFKTENNTDDGAHETTTWYSHLPHNQKCDSVIPLYVGEQM